MSYGEFIFVGQHKLTDERDFFAIYDVRFL